MQAAFGEPDPAAWRPVALPAAERETSWFRLRFQAPASRSDSWAVYLPYLAGGGTIRLNGELLAQVETSTADRIVRWERPFLFVLPDSLLRSGWNDLQLQVVRSDSVPRARLPLVSVGSHADLLTHYERREFWLRTVPQFTVLACAMVGALGLFIWWRRREELLYGLFGLALLLWGGRTLTFVIEALPADAWWLWRLFYFLATGGFIIVLTVFALRLSGFAFRKLEAGLLVYWALGPLAYILAGGTEELVTRVWTGGLIPIGIGLLAASVIAAFRRRRWDTSLLCTGLGVGVLSGIHDYLLVTSSPLLAMLAPQWTGHRVFILHYGANLLLLMMGAILSARFVEALQAVEQLNRTLESRIKDREQALADNYESLALLQRKQAASDERQRIMADLHDGLGSQLFVTLSRVETRQIGHDAISQALRDCIADMRLALEVMGSGSNDLLDAWGSFRHRWERQLDAAGVRSDWAIPPHGICLPGGASLQLLRIVQEALTNVLKHSGARQVFIGLSVADGVLSACVRDDGRGQGPTDDWATGRGIGNIKVRAARLGGTAGWRAAQPGTLMEVRVPLT